jgi:hypothetical protein
MAPEIRRRLLALRRDLAEIKALAAEARRG